MATKPKDNMIHPNSFKPEIHKRKVYEVYEYETVIEDEKMDKLIENHRYAIRVKIDKENGKITLENEKGKDEFIFTDYINGETKERWIAVARLIQHAINEQIGDDTMPF